MPYTSERMAEIISILVMPAVDAGLIGVVVPVRGGG
jgi:hypothetical protein